MSIGAKRPEGERSVGEIMSAVFSIYSSHFAEMVIPFVLAGLVSGFLSYSTFAFLPVEEMTTDYSNLNAVMGNLGRLMLSIFFLGLVSTVLYTAAGGMVVKFTSDIIETGKGSVQTSFDEMIARFPSLFAVSLITALLTGVGFIFLIVPGVILAIIFSLTIPTVMIERRGVFESLSRSQRLVDSRWRKTFGLLLMIGVIIMLASILGAAFSSVFPLLGNILSTTLGSVVEPLYFIAITILYHSMVIREQVNI
jgi:hypothetical protein